MQGIINRYDHIDPTDRAELTQILTTFQRSPGNSRLGIFPLEANLKITMMISSKSIVFFVSTLLVGLQVVLGQQQKLWDPTTDPSPPTQPAEYGCATSASATWNVVSSGENVLNVAAYGYTYGSLQHLSQLSQIAGSESGNQSIHLSVTDYNDPTSQTASLVIYYNTQTCLETGTEGNSDYPGDAYYASLLTSYYSIGIPIYLEYVNISDFGWCLQYTALAPWFNNALPRSINYTLTFQNDTGYLLDYVLSGTEYCCFSGVDKYCPNEGNCTDGSQPQQIYTVSGTYYRDYSLFTSFDESFFEVACPYTSVEASDNDSNDKLSSKVVVGIAFGSAIFGFIIAIITYFFLPARYVANTFLAKKQADDLLSPGDRSL